MNEDLTLLLDSLDHPQRENIEELRQLMLSVHPDLEESVKWNGPNYSVGGKDRFTVKVQPKGDFQLILHCGAKASPSAGRKILSEDYPFVVWRANDRALISLKDPEVFQNTKNLLGEILRVWLDKTL